MRSLNAARDGRPDYRVENQVRISLGTLAGVEGEVVGEMDDDRLVVAVRASDDPTAGTIPGLYIFLQRESVEAVDQ